MNLMLLPNVSLGFHIFNLNIKIVQPVFVLLPAFNNTRLKVTPPLSGWLHRAQSFPGCVVGSLVCLLSCFSLFASEYDPRLFLLRFYNCFLVFSVS